MVKCSKGRLRRLKTAMRWKSIAAAQRQRIQMVLLRESGMTQPAIAEAMGVSLSTVNRVHMAYDQGGLQALKPKPNGGRKRENMSLAAERALLARFPKAAGGLLEPPLRRGPCRFHDIEAHPESLVCLVGEFYCLAETYAVTVILSRCAANFESTSPGFCS